MPGSEKLSLLLKIPLATILKILYPIKSWIEHGMELHSNSLVFDAYDFHPIEPIADLYAKL